MHRMHFECAAEILFSKLWYGMKNEVLNFYQNFQMKYNYLSASPPSKDQVVESVWFRLTDFKVCPHVNINGSFGETHLTETILANIYYILFGANKKKLGFYYLPYFPVLRVFIAADSFILQNLR